MKIVRFEDILAWQKARDLAKSCYSLSQDVRDYSFRDQFQRASVSIMNNIAEGYERQSTKDFQKFLFIARGSCGEVRSMLYLGSDLGYISKSDFDDLHGRALEISRMLYGLVKKLDNIKKT